MTRTIFIRDASREFGRIWTEAFLQRGDNVVAAVRTPEALTQLTKKSPSNLLVLKFGLMDAENPPLRLLLGKTAYPWVKHT